MGTLSSLLRWKKALILKDSQGKSILGDDGEPLTVWVRIISDKDLEDAFKKARIASAEIRAHLLDPEHEEYKAIVQPFETASYDQLYDMALAGIGANWVGEALSTVIRPELVKISEVARDPDAPTLEEQEKVDAKNAELDEKYNKELTDFIDTKEKEARTKLDPLTMGDLLDEAKNAILITVPIEKFLSELAQEKLWRAVYYDEACTKRGFTDVEDFRQTLSVIKDQIKEAYEELEAGHNQIKN